MPGYNYQAASDQEWAQMYKHLEYIRSQEAQRSVELAKIGLVANGPGRKARRR